MIEKLSMIRLKVALWLIGRHTLIANAEIDGDDGVICSIDGRVTYMRNVTMTNFRTAHTVRAVDFDPGHGR